MSNADDDKQGLTYRDAGVDIDAGNALVERIKPAVRATSRPEVLGGLGGFGGLFALDLGKFRQPVLVSGTDGVGTKLILAQQLDSHHTIGQDLVAMCVNDVLVTGAEPLYFLDYFACGTLDVDQAEAVVKGIAKGCELAGCALIGGETAEMPDMYPTGKYDLAGFSVGAVERDAIIDGSTIQPDQTVLAIASTGPHSNGYSLIRRVIERSGADLKEPLSDGTVLGEALIAPTRIYVPGVLDLLRSHRIHGMAHITGGGLAENLERVLPPGIGARVERKAWPQPPVFDWLQKHGNINDGEMLRAFNCGIGFCLIIDNEQLDGAQAVLRQHGWDSFAIGSTCRDDDGTVTVS